MKKGLQTCKIVLILSFVLIILNENLFAKVMELNIRFWEDRVIMIVTNGGLMWIWTFFRKLYLTSKEHMSYPFPQLNLSRLKSRWIACEEVEMQLTSDSDISMTLWIL